MLRPALEQQVIELRRDGVGLDWIGAELRPWPGSDIGTRRSAQSEMSRRSNQFPARQITSASGPRRRCTLFDSCSLMIYGPFIVVQSLAPGGRACTECRQTRLSSEGGVQNVRRT